MTVLTVHDGHLQMSVMTTLQGLISGDVGGADLLVASLLIGIEISNGF